MFDNISIQRVKQTFRTLIYVSKKIIESSIKYLGGLKTDLGLNTDFDKRF